VGPNLEVCVQDEFKKNNLDDEPGFVDLLRKMAKEGSWRELLASEHGISSLCFD